MFDYDNCNHNPHKQRSDKIRKNIVFTSISFANHILRIKWLIEKATSATAAWVSWRLQFPVTELGY